jgi:hypothetical protein
VCRAAFWTYVFLFPLLWVVTPNLRPPCQAYTPHSSLHVCGAPLEAVYVAS